MNGGYAMKVVVQPGVSEHYPEGRTEYMFKGYSKNFIENLIIHTFPMVKGVSRTIVEWPLKEGG